MKSWLKSPTASAAPKCSLSNDRSGPISWESRRLSAGGGEPDTHRSELHDHRADLLFDVGDAVVQGNARGQVVDEIAVEVADRQGGAEMLSALDQIARDRVVRYGCAIHGRQADRPGPRRRAETDEQEQEEQRDCAGHRTSPSELARWGRCAVHAEYAQEAGRKAHATRAKRVGSVAEAFDARTN